MWKKVVSLQNVISSSMLLVNMAGSTTSQCVRLGPIVGHNKKVNDVLFYGDPLLVKPDSHIVFFGGDVQDYKENMESYLPHKSYVQWNLEDTAKILQYKYPKSMIWVIRPYSMVNSTFSVYSNFLTSIFNGAPDQTVPFKNQGSWFHLSELLTNSIQQIYRKIDLLSSGIVTLNDKGDDERDISSRSKESSVNLPDVCDNNSKCDSDAVELSNTDSNMDAVMGLPIHIIGFSKGCVVLNQLLYDLEQSLNNDTDDKIQSFLQRVESMTWLDGGHAGGLNTWVTDKDVITYLKELPNIAVKVHVTPYQVKDPLRPWIGKEQKKFVRTLKSLGVTVEQTLHFTEEEASLENHFKVLLAF